MTRTLTLCRAVAAMLVLVALVFLSPVFLSSFGNPTREVFGAFGDELASDASRSEALLVGALVVIGWIAWLMITAAVINEIWAALRGRMARHLPLLPGVQPLARNLVTSVTLVGSLLSTTQAAAAPLAAIPSEPTLAQFDPQEPVEPRSVPERDTSSPAPAGSTYQVARSDTWWSMAERLLGSGSRWREIVDANDGRTMVDDTVVSAATSSPRPGWVVLLPADAVLPLSLSDPEESPAAVGPHEHLVVAGDTLWDIALERLPPESSTAHIADTVRLLFEANRSRVQSDGRSLTEPSVLEPGWILDISALSEDAAIGAAPPDSVVVEPGDTLWDLAEGHLGSGQRYTEIVERNRDVPQPGGGALVDPDLIVPGWHLELPPSEPLVTDSPSPGRGESPVEAPVPSPAVPVDAEPTAPTPGSEANEHTTPETWAPAVPVPPAPTTQPAVVETPDASGDDETRTVPAGLLAAGIATAGAVLMLDRRRRVQRQRRRAGHVLPAPTMHEERAEYRLRQGADVPRAERVAVALQAAAAGFGHEDFPAVRYVSVTDDDVRMHLVDVPSEVPAGFEAIDRTWVTAVGHAELLALAEGGVDPLPLLCPIGTTADGVEEVLVDLARPGVAWILGPEDHVMSLVRSMALSLSTSVWASSPRVVAVGMSGGIADLDWVETKPTLVEGLTVACHNLPTDPVRRSSGTGLDPGDPVVVVSSTTSWDIHTHQLESISQAAPSGSAAVLPGPGLDGVGVVATIDTDGRVEFPGIDVGIQAHYLSEDDVRVVLDILDHAAEPGTDVPAPSELPVGVRSMPTLADEFEDYDVLVRVMGDVTVERLGSGAEAEAVVFERTRSQEAVVYLAAREEGRGVAIEDVRAALWPDGRAVDQTVRNTISRARSGLGDDADGDPYLPAPVDGRYHLSARVVTDFEVFWSMRETACELDDPDLADHLMDQALQLVRGEPFLGPGRGYAWTSAIGTTIVVAVVDVAEQLGRSRLERDDPRGAERAARSGLTIAPGEERLYRILMRAAATQDSKPMVERLYREMLDVLADPDLGIEPEATVSDETVALFNGLMGRRGRRTA